jgi:hypothetical protein
MTANSSHLTTVTVGINHDTLAAPSAGFVDTLRLVELRQRQFWAFRAHDDVEFLMSKSDGRQAVGGRSSAPLYIIPSRPVDPLPLITTITLPTSLNASTQERSVSSNNYIFLQTPPSAT